MRPLTIILAAALAGCGSTAPDEPEAGSGTWALAHQQQDGVVVSVWGARPDNLWAAGGQVERGLVLHGDGTHWAEVPTPAHSLLWSVYGFALDDVYAVGERGLIMHFDGTSWSRAESGTDRTLFGLWGASGSDVWVVGGDPSGPAGSAVVLRGSGTSFRPVDDVPSELLPESLFKVYGTGPRDVIAVGRGGTVLHWRGEGWSRDDVPTHRPLVSLWGRGPNDLFAVGGQDVGEVLHFDGTSWSEVNRTGFVPGLTGVFTGPTGPVFAVGGQSDILAIAPDGQMFREQAPALANPPVLHSVWGDAQGTVYAVGGDLLKYPDPMQGVILRRQ